jgi:hypothetical protein
MVQGEEPIGLLSLSPVRHPGPPFGVATGEVSGPCLLSSALRGAHTSASHGGVPARAVN